MNPHEVALGLIPALYDAAINEDRFERALDSVAEVLDGYMLAVALELPGGERPPCLYASGGDPQQVALYSEHFHTVDPTLVAAKGVSTGKLVRLESLVSAEAYRNSEFYVDYMQPSGYAWGPSYHALLAREQEHVAATMVATKQQGAADLGEYEVSVLELLVPHLITVRSNWVTLQQTTIRDAQITDTFDLLPFAVFIVDARARVLVANRAARALAADRDGLCLEQGALHAHWSSASQRLEKLVGEACRTSHGTGLSPGGALALPRASGRRPLELRVTPLPRETTALETGGAAAVFAIDPEDRPPGAEEVLATLYGLTPAEAKLAALLSRDLSISEAADHLGVSRETARHHLKALFGKTQTNRQASLVRLLVRGAASLGAASPR